jgi:hypothetical protein
MDPTCTAPGTACLWIAVSTVRPLICTRRADAIWMLRSFKFSTLQFS